MDDDEHEATHGLVMPFVVTTSHGGPYDDKAFVAGYTAGRIDAKLEAVRTIYAKIEAYVDPALVPQLDLIAMQHGYSFTHKPWDDFPYEWTRATFEPVASTPWPEEQT